MVSAIIPTYNAEKYLPALLNSLKGQSVPCEIIVIDSSSSDNTVEISESYGVRTISIRKEDFDHGRTRTLAGEEANGDILVYLTQDALPFDRYAIERLIKPLQENKQIGAAYGRQLPRKSAVPIEAHARLFNYPETSKVKHMDDAPQLGIKTAFISNSFAAYRRSPFEAMGGFPSKTILSEDMYVAAKMLLNGWKVAYCADAQVYHSHNYTFIKEFQRYFDQGVFHYRESWIRKSFGHAESEGLKYIRSELAYLLRKNALLIPSALLRTFFKYCGYKLGFMEKKIPIFIKRHLSMHNRFWD